MNLHAIRLSLTAILSAAGFCLALQPACAEEAPTAKLRLLCASSLGESQRITVAYRNDSGQWKEFGKVELRPSMVSEWITVRSGDLHIALWENGKLESKGTFTCPAGAKRVIVAVHADTADNTYKAYAIDPDKEGFVKGTTLIINMSDRQGIVSLGAEEHPVKPGLHRVVKPVPDEHGGYRTTLAHADEAGHKTLCYDKLTIPNQSSRSTLILQPDEAQVMRVVSLSEFGPFD